MARIDHLEQKDAVRTSIHSPVDATFHVFEADGVRYLQIDTYGSGERQIMGKTSQSIQFGEEGLAQLRQILEKLA
ncbi:methionyl-tRNA formyltransferase [Tabrizicola sp. WMC-M-20]|nr:methionyl-tRNA formyltransferase [Tabrizicola sp. WMC-M-20]